MHLYIYEEEPELLARHLLLVSVLLDGSLMAKERMEALLELHSNVLLREKAAKYLGMRHAWRMHVSCMAPCTVCTTSTMMMLIKAFPRSRQQHNIWVIIVHAYTAQP